MQKHKLIIRSWKPGKVFLPELHGGVSKMHLYSTCLLTGSFEDKEYSYNWLDQNPMELGDYLPSFQVSPHKRVKPVEAYSVDGLLYRRDKGHLLDSIPETGIQPSSTPGWVDAYCRLGDTLVIDNDRGITVVYSDPGFLGSGKAQRAYAGLYVLQRETSSKITSMTAQFYDPLNGLRTLVSGYVATRGLDRRLSDADWSLVLQDPTIISANWLSSTWARSGEAWTSSSFRENSASPSDDGLPAMPSYDALITTRDIVNAPWAQLARDAYNNIESGFDGNGIALVGDLVGSTTSARDTLASLSNIGLARKPKAFFNAVASSYLSFRYGWKLLISDVKNLRQSLLSNEASRFTNTTAQMTSSNDDITTTLTYQVFYDKYGGILNDLSALEQLTDVLDLQLDLGNIWDLTKYSFVLDWFLDVGSVLESMDGYYNIAYRYDVKAAGQSMKVVKSFTPDGFVGNVNVTAYRRKYCADAIPPSPLPATHQPRSQSWIDGAALVVQRV